MNIFGIDIFQLIIYACVIACTVVMVYILKLQRNKTKTSQPTVKRRSSTFTEHEADQPMEEKSSDAITMEIIDFLREMWRHQVGLDSHSCSDTILPPPPPPSEPQTLEPETPTTKDQTENKPESQKKEMSKKPTARLSKVNEENYVSTEEDNELLNRMRERLKEKG